MHTFTDIKTERNVIASILIGTEIQNARRSLELSQNKLAHGICSQPMLSLIEHGLQLPMPDVLKMLAMRLGSDSLDKYASEIESNTLGNDGYSATQLDVLSQFFSNYDGKWTKEHEEIALYLCELYYNQLNWKLLMNVTGSAINNKMNVSDSTYLKSCFFHGSALLRELKYQEGINVLELALDNLYILNPEQQGKLLYNLAFAYGEIGAQGIALSHSIKAAEIFRRHDFYHFYGRTMGQLGVIYMRMQQFKESLLELNKAYELLLNIGGALQDVARIECSLATVYFLTEDYNNVEFWCHKTIQTGAQSKDTRSMYMGYRDLIAVNLVTSSANDIDAYIEPAIKLAMELNDPVCSVEIKLIIGIALKNIQIVKEALVLSKSLDTPIFEAEIAEYLSFLYKMDGKIDEAQNYELVAFKAYRKYAQKNFKKLPFTLLLPTHEFN